MGKADFILAGAGLCFVVLVIVLSAGGGTITKPFALDFSSQARDHFIDGHNDLPGFFRANANNRVEKGWIDLRANLTGAKGPPREGPHFNIPMMTDIPRLKAGQVTGQFWSVWVSCKTQHRSAPLVTMEQIDVVRRMTHKYREFFEMAMGTADLERILSEGKFASMIGIEGGHSIDSSLGALRMFHRLGVRYMTLTHNCDTRWATHHNSSAPSQGLTPFGRKVVKEMNRIGMFVDLSHVSVQTMKDALEVAKAPVIFSHSSARAICNHTRNVPDDVARLVTANKGVIMINFYPGYISCSKSSTVGQVADHIEHLVKVAGVDHVGIGADMDGVEVMPVGLEDVSKYPALFQELADRGMSSEDIRKVKGGNLIRAMKAMEQYSLALQAGSDPLQRSFDPEDAVEEPLFPFVDGKECDSANETVLAGLGEQTDSTYHLYENWSSNGYKPPRNPINP